MCIYLEEEKVGFIKEHRGRKSTGRQRKQPLDKYEEEDLMAENQRLRGMQRRLRGIA